MKEKMTVTDDPYNVELESRKGEVRREVDSKFSEEFHLKGKAGWICDLYLELDKSIMALSPTVRKEYLQTYIKYSHNGVLFAYIQIGTRERLKVWVKVHYKSLKSPPLFVRDYEGSSHRAGVIVTFDNEREYLEAKPAMLDATVEVLKRAFKWVSGKKRAHTPLKTTTHLLSEQPQKKEVKLSIGSDGFVEVTIRVHKSQLGKILSDIVQ